MTRTIDWEKTEIFYYKKTLFKYQPSENANLVVSQLLNYHFLYIFFFNYICFKLLLQKKTICGSLNIAKCSNNLSKLWQSTENP